MLIRIAYVADHLSLISLSPLMDYFTFMQATRYIVSHTRVMVSPRLQTYKFLVALLFILMMPAVGELYQLLILI
jgi:hypothetical protein